MTKEDLLAPMEFEEELKEVPVKIGDEKFILKEADGLIAVTYRNEVMSRTRALQNANGAIKPKDGLAGIEPMLISMVLFTEDGSAVAKSRIQGWSNAVQRALFDRAKALGSLEEKRTLADLKAERKQLDETIKELEAAGYEEEPDEESKNSPSSTTDGSD